MTPPDFKAVAAILALCVAGCRAPREGVAEQEVALAGRISEEVSRIENLGGESLSWKSALALMNERNIEINESRNQILSAEDSLKQIYRDLIPGGSISAGVNTALTDLANLSGDDFALSVFSFLNLPGVIAYRVRYYASTLELMRARWAYELRVREKTIQLHEVFLQQQLLLERTKNIRLSSRFQPRQSILSGLDTTPESLRKEELALNLERQSRAIQAQISRLLGSSRSRWKLDSSGLPDWDYVKRPLTLKNPKEFGTLFRQLQALQLEGQRLSKLGVKLRYWPDLRISVSTPALFTVTEGRRNGFDFDQLFVSLSTSVQLDTRLSIWTQLKQLERRIALDRQRLAQENSILIEQLMTNQKALELNAKQIRLNEIRIRAMRKEERSLDPRKSRDQLENSLSLSERRASLIIEKANLQSSLWLLDERRWDRVKWDEPEKDVKKK